MQILGLGALSRMPLSENPEARTRSGKLSLVLPLASGQDLPVTKSRDIDRFSRKTAHSSRSKS